MILTISEAKEMVDCSGVTDSAISARLAAIESIIRRYTNNSFQLRGARFDGALFGSCVIGSPVGISAGDTVQLSCTTYSDGIYTVSDVTQDGITLDADPLSADPEFALVTKVKYPPDVVQCAADLFAWSVKNGDKVGIKSETISRHSVTYEDSSTLYMGYPTGILDGLKMYRKARF